MSTAVPGAEEDWRAEFVRLLSSGEREDWDHARSLRMSKMPPRLFRYRAPSPNSFKGLERQTIWLSAASAFNDLHDTSVVVDAEKALEASLAEDHAAGTLQLPDGAEGFLPPIAKDMIGALDALWAAEVEKQAGPSAAARAKDFFRKRLINASAEMSNKATEFMQRRTKVACFCEASDVPLLWGHYADGHRGFCIEYPLDALPRDDLRIHWLLPVIYSAERLNLIKLIAQARGKINPFAPWLAAMHKSPDWAYEREWRIVDTVGDDIDGREILMPTPSRLLVGYRMTGDNRKTLATIAKAHGIPVVEMVPTGEFTMSERPVDPA